MEGDAAPGELAGALGAGGEVAGEDAGTAVGGETEVTVGGATGESAGGVSGAAVGGDMGARFGGEMVGAAAGAWAKAVTTRRENARANIWTAEIAIVESFSGEREKEVRDGKRESKWAAI